MKWSADGLFAVVLAGFLLALPAARAQVKDKLDLDKIPKKRTAPGRHGPALPSALCRLPSALYSGATVTSSWQTASSCSPEIEARCSA